MSEELKDGLSVSLTYAERRPYLFADDTLYSMEQLVVLLRPSLNARRASAARRATAQETLDVLKRLQVERGLSMFEGRKVQRVYVAAAKLHKWFAKTPNVSIPPSPDGFKYCTACVCEREIDLFMAPATAAQRRAYRWPDGYRPVVQHKLCVDCRVKAAKDATYKEKRKRLKAEMRERSNPNVAHWAKLRHSVQNELASIRSSFQARCQSFTDEQGVVHKSYVFVSDAHKAYYEERKRLVLEAQARLKAFVDSGELYERGDAAVWYSLLTDEERHQLGVLFSSITWWSPKGKRPVLWN